MLRIPWGWCFLGRMYQSVIQVKHYLEPLRFTHNWVEFLFLVASTASVLFGHLRSTRPDSHVFNLPQSDARKSYQFKYGKPEDNGKSSKVKENVLKEVGNQLIKPLSDFGFGLLQSCLSVRKLLLLLSGFCQFYRLCFMFFQC